MQLANKHKPSEGGEILTLWDSASWIHVGLSSQMFLDIIMISPTCLQIPSS
jgi:hypothetical protein